MNPVRVSELSDETFEGLFKDFQADKVRREKLREVEDMSAPYIILEHWDGRDRAKLHTNGTGWWTTLFFGRAAAEEVVASLNERRKTFRAVLLNSNEARAALRQGVTGADAVQHLADGESDTPQHDKKIYGSEATLGEFYKVVEPVMEFINAHFDPHTMVIIDCTNAEILSGLATHNTMKFVKD